MVLGAYIASKSALKTYIKERLGEPVVRVEVTDVQIEHAINTTLERFIEFSEGGLNYRFKTISIVAGTQEYSMDFDVYSIIHVYDTSSYSLGLTIFDDNSVTGLTEANPLYEQLVRQDLLTIELSRQYIETLEFMLKVKVGYDYNTVTRQLYLLESPARTLTGGILYYQRADYSDTDSLIYDNAWVKKYSVALTKHQWGSNLTKYTGSTLPAGLQLNAESILTNAETEIEKLEEELELVYRTPTDFFLG